MRILCIDVGTGTQDILLFDSEQEIENCIQLVMPSPTQFVARRVQQATAEGKTLLLTGVTMGGGPGAWAVEAHIKAGFEVYANADAARTFDDDLDRVSAMGVRVVLNEDLLDLWEQLGDARAALISMQDFHLPQIELALHAFGEPARYDALAVAAFDHGAAPPGYSDRRFRFDYISRNMQRWGAEPVERALSAFASPAPALDRDLTRLQAVASTAQTSIGAEMPLLLMDTGPASLLGALGDPIVRGAAAGNMLFANVGNFHTLAFHITGNKIRALFEHHTGLLDGPKLVGLLQKLAGGALSNDEVFSDSGHGALLLHAEDAEGQGGQPTLCAVTGPRRGLLSAEGAPWPIYFAVPHGDMMMAGCYGLLRAYAAHFPAAAATILSRLDGQKEQA